MTVLSIQKVNVDDATVSVTAVVDDMLLVRKETYLDPAEWGPAICHAVFSLYEDDQMLPTNEEELCNHLDALDLKWEVVDVSDY